MREGTVLPQPGRLCDRNGSLSPDGRARTADLVAHLREERMSFEMTVSRTDLTLYVPEYIILSSPSCVDQCDIIRAVLFLDVEWRGLGPGLQIVWRSTPLPSVWLDL